MVLFRKLLFTGAALVATSTLAPAQAADVAISSSVNGSTMTVSADTTKFAGAIYSLTYRGQQYVNAADHGRELQSAVSYDTYGECLNPTEAGSRNDGNGSTSSSASLSASNAGNVLQTSTNMAHWLAPGTNYGMQCGSSAATTAQNTTVLSGTNFSKTVSFGYNGIPNLLQYDVNYYVPAAHSTATFEAVTGYMPSTFSNFLFYNPVNKQLGKLTASTTGQNSQLPVIVSTPNGQHAMGVMSASISPASPYYDYFLYAHFPGNVSKWNCVFGKTSIAAGSNHSFSCPIAVGTVDEVVAAIGTFSGSSTALTSVYRFVSGVRHLWTSQYTEGASFGAFEGVGFRVFSSGSGGYVPLYRCNRTNGPDHFASASSNCEGYTYVGVYGYMSTTSAPGLSPLYRFHQSSIGQHLMTTNYSEGVAAGFTYEGTLGYVPL